LQQQRKYKKLLELRNRIFEEHNNKCDKCGFNNPRALVIHHHFGSHKQNNYYQQLKELIDQKVPISVLCANCHMIVHNPKKLA